MFKEVYSSVSIHADIIVYIYLTVLKFKLKPVKPECFGLKSSQTGTYTKSAYLPGWLAQFNHRAFTLPLLDIRNQVLSCQFVSILLQFLEPSLF